MLGTQVQKLIKVYEKAEKGNEIVEKLRLMKLEQFTSKPKTSHGRPNFHKRQSPDQK